ncbi:MAG: UDP-N-acetylmuramoyl-tripeptide--D-alanyl-D-alanine ligase [Candidatus Limivicinus sp.]
MNISVSQAARICGGKLIGEKNIDCMIGRVIIDSRAIEPGDLFVAYKGERVDGHDYIATALEKGAVCCLAERLPEGIAGGVILVDDVQKALEQLCTAYRERLELPVVGITGSVGKTTAKEMVWSVLSQKLNVLKTEGNLNNQIGVPMTLSRITTEHQAAVVEMGISGFGEMTELARMARPTVAVFTVIGHAHLEFLHNLEGVFQAKTEMLPLMPENGTVIVNGDDPWLRTIKCKQRLIRCGFSDDCQVRAENIRLLPEGRTRCDIVYGEKRVQADIPAHGRHMVYAAMEAAAVGFTLGLSPEEIERGISAYQVVGRRGAVTVTEKLTLVDDCYNANPDSMRCAIDSLKDLPGRHVAILADMLEMGSGGEQMHYDLGRYAAGNGMALVLCCGQLGQKIAEGAGGKGRWFENRQALAAALPKLLEQGDTVLVKASRGMHLEEIAEQLKTM